MLDIYVPKNLITNLISLRKKDWHEDLKEDDIFEKIRETLIHDEIIKKNEKINFHKINKQFQGIFIKEQNLVIYFTQMLNFKGVPRSRNTYISQNFQPAFNFASSNTFSASNSQEISISINPFDLGKSLPISAESIIKDFKTLVSMGVNINKSIPFKYEMNEIFDNLDDYIFFRNKLKSKNKGNNSTYIKIFDEEKNITIYGRLDGANYSDTINTCMIVAQLNKERFNLSFCELNSSVNIKKTSLEKISQIGFVIINSVEEEKLLEKELSKVKKEDEQKIENILKRNQKLFIRNIIEKYINVENFDLHKCFACDYIIESNFIASHIYRYSDILKDFFNKKINIDLAVHLIVSGENGFLLCPNQDKEFEKGMIYFDVKSKKFILNKKKLNSNEISLLNNRLINQDFTKINYTEEFEENIKNHIDRINL